MLTDEIIISEDGDSREMKEFIAGYKFLIPIQHIFQEDKGWQKNAALNRAIKASSYPYLIFIDEDCLLHPLFIKNHLILSDANAILAGKRIKLGPAFSEAVINNGLPWLLKNFWRKYSQLKKDKALFIEEALILPVNKFNKFVIEKLGISAVKGCNFSLYKKAVYAINGFDEDYIKYSVGEDYDLGWRLEGLGYHIKSIKHFAIQYHLYHTENLTKQTENLALLKIKQAKKEYRCKNGLIKE